MEENKLVPTEQRDLYFDEEISGVQVKRSNRRGKRKKNRGKKLLILLLVICLTIIVVKNFSYIKNFAVSLFTDSENTENSKQDSVDTADSSNKSDNPIQDSNKNEQITEQKYEIIDTSPEKTTIIYENSSSIDYNGLMFDLPNKSRLTGIYGNDAPLVLIVNFSPKECYLNSSENKDGSSFYSESGNVEALGEYICLALNEKGINTLHLKNTSQKSSLTEIKQEYAKSIVKLLAENPSISYIFDISREIEFDNEMRIIKETVTLNDTKLPTIRLTSGTNGNDVTTSQKKSVYLASALTESFNSSAELFVSRQTVSKFELNMNFACPCVRVDIGSYACSLEEATLSADLFVQLFTDYLNK